MAEITLKYEGETWTYRNDTQTDEQARAEIIDMFLWADEKNNNDMFETLQSFGISTKAQFVDFWKNGAFPDVAKDPKFATPENKHVIWGFVESVKNEIECNFLFFVGTSLRFALGSNANLSDFYKEILSTPAPVVTITDEKAKLLVLQSAYFDKVGLILTSYGKKTEIHTPKATDTAPDKGADVSGVPSSMETDKGDLSKEEAKRNEENADTEKEPKTPVSYDFYKILEVVKVDEKTKQILEFLALEFGDAIRNFTKNAPQLKAPQKADLIRGGAWDLSDIIKPIVLTPREWAGRLYPEYMKKNGVTKAIKKTLTAFAPLQNATIVREVIDEKTGQLVKRVTPVFMIEYDFIDGTPDDVINKFRSNPLEFLKNEETGAENLINIRVRPSAPLITNQYNDVNGGSVWRKYILAEKSEDRTKGARRLGVLNVPKVKTDKILKVEEMAKDTQTRPAKQTALFGDIAETARKVYGSNYQYDAKKKIFVDPGKAEEKPRKTEAKQKAETATRPARQTKGRGRPKKEK